MSKPVSVHARLQYPVIDSDFRTVTFAPVLEDYVARQGGAASVDKFRSAIARAHAAEREPSRRDAAAGSLPRLLHERIAESGRDYALLFPSVSAFVMRVDDPDLRRALVRAVNEYHRDVYAPYAERLTPAAAIPLHTPEEGVEELEFAISGLGLKVASIPSNVRRPLRSTAEDDSSPRHADFPLRGTWLDTFGCDSAYDYDAFWAKAVALKTVLTTRAAGTDGAQRFASSEALAKSLFFGGVTRRFPDLRVGFLGAGAGWGARLYADLVGRWETRIGDVARSGATQASDVELLYRMYREYGGAEEVSRRLAGQAAEGVATGAAGASLRQPQELGACDDFARAGISKAGQVRECYVQNFYFGSDANDPTVLQAFDGSGSPFGAALNALWASGSGAPHVTELLFDTWTLVERGALGEQDFKDLVFTRPYRFFAGKNAEFFRGTRVEHKLSCGRAA